MRRGELAMGTCRVRKHFFVTCPAASGGAALRGLGPSDINEEEGAGTAMPDKDAEVELDSGAEAESGSEPGPGEASKPEVEKTERAKQ